MQPFTKPIPELAGDGRVLLRTCVVRDKMGQAFDETHGLSYHDDEKEEGYG
jgi:hypothetical protein